MTSVAKDSATFSSSANRCSKNFILNIVAGFGGNGMFDKVAMNAPEVVKAGLDGIDKNKAVVIPGLINKAGALSGRFAPRSVVRKIAGAIKY